MLTLSAQFFLHANLYIKNKQNPLDIIHVTPRGCDLQ